MNFKFLALLSYTKTTKCVKFQGVWCTGVRVGVFRISPIKEVSKAVNLDWINNQAWRLSHNIYVITNLFITNNYLFENDKENHFYQLFF